MFTLKFYRSIEEGTLSANVCCPLYTTSERDGETTITIHNTHTQADGIDYQITKDIKGGYDSCYIENSAGKTIAHYTAK